MTILTERCSACLRPFARLTQVIVDEHCTLCLEYCAPILFDENDARLTRETGQADGAWRLDYLQIGPGFDPPIK